MLNEITWPTWLRKKSGGTITRSIRDGKMAVTMDSFFKFPWFHITNIIGP